MGFTQYSLLKAVQWPIVVNFCVILVSCGELSHWQSYQIFFSYTCIFTILICVFGLLPSLFLPNLICVCLFFHTIYKTCSTYPEMPIIKTFFSFIPFLRPAKTSLIYSLYNERLKEKYKMYMITYHLFSV